MAIGKPITGNGVVTTAGTAVAMSTVRGQLVVDLHINADAGNTSYVLVGNASVLATSGSQQGAYAGKPSATTTQNLVIRGPVDLSELYVDAVTSGDKFAWFALEADPTHPS